MNAPAICDAMTLMPTTVEVNDTLGKAQELMTTHDIRHLPVTENGKLVGILSDRDIQLGMSVEDHFGSSRTLSVKYVCSFNPFCVSPNEALDTVAAHMAKEHISSALIVQGGKVEGIFTASDACRWIGQHFKKA